MEVSKREEKKKELGDEMMLRMGELEKRKKYLLAGAWAVWG